MPEIVKVKGGYRIEVGKKIFPMVYSSLADAQKRVDELVRHSTK